MRQPMPRLSPTVCAVLLVILAVFTSGVAVAADYCIDAAIGSDSNSGLCPSAPWRSFSPTLCRAFASGDRVLIAAGSYVYPQTGWHMTPGLSWIGAGTYKTTVAINFSPATPVPFVRFRQGAAGSGPLCRQCPSPCPFTAATVLSDMTLFNGGNASVGVDIATTSGTAAPTIQRLRIDGFARGIVLHPSDDESVAATVSATLSADVIAGGSDAGIESFADNFYGRAVNETSTITNVMADSAGAGLRIKTLVNDLRDKGSAIARPTLTNGTITGGSESAILLISYFDDGTGARRVKVDAGVVTPTLKNSICTSSSRFGIEEYSAFTEPALVTGNAMGGNTLGDYLDEGTITRAAPTVGTGNTSDVAVFVDALLGDLHVMPGSPTIDRLAAATAPTTDVDGHVRPQGAMSDQGADEWVPCTVSADATASVDPPRCSGLGGQLDGSRTTVSPVCSAGLSYSWYEGTTLIGSTAVVPVSPVVPTNYKLHAVCADRTLSACFAETTRAVAAVTTAPVTNAGPDAETCETPGSPVVFVLSGSSIPVAPATITTYAWTTTAGTLATPAAATSNLTLPAGFSGVVTVTLNATDSTGCADSDTAVLTVRPAPTVNAGADSQQCSLPGSSARFNLSGTAAGVAPATLASSQWSATAGTIANQAALITTLDVNTSATTTLVTATLLAIDSFGCRRTDTSVYTLKPTPTAVPGGPWSVMQSGGPTTDIPLDGSASTGEGVLNYAWTTDLGTFVNTGTASSALNKPTLRVVNNNNKQTANVCLTVTSANGCASSRVCAIATVRIVAALPPNDIRNTLKAVKAAPSSVVLSWQDAAADATHDLALNYEVWRATVKCGPYAATTPTVARVPGINGTTITGVVAPPTLRFYEIVSLNDGGVSVPAPPDGTTCR